MEIIILFVSLHPSARMIFVQPRMQQRIPYENRPFLVPTVHRSAFRTKTPPFSYQWPTAIRVCTKIIRADW